MVQSNVTWTQPNLTIRWGKVIFYVSFCVIFMHFLGITHIWMIVLSCISISAQLSEKSWNLHFYLKISLSHNRGTFNMIVVSNMTMIIWWLPFWIASTFRQWLWWIHYRCSPHHDGRTHSTTYQSFSITIFNHAHGGF